MRFVKKVTPGIIQLVVFFYINYFYLIQVTNIRTISLMKKVQGLSIGFGCTITKYWIVADSILPPATDHE